MRRSKKTSKLCVTGLCVGNSPVTGEFPTQRASITENVSIWWRHHANSPKHLQLKSIKILFIHNILLSCPIILKFTQSTKVILDNRYEQMRVYGIWIYPIEADWANIVSDNGFSPVQHQAFFGINAGWHIANCTPGDIFKWNSNINTIHFIKENAFENVFKMAAILSRPECVEMSLRDISYITMVPWHLDMAQSGGAALAGQGLISFTNTMSLTLPSFGPFHLLIRYVLLLDLPDHYINWQSRSYCKILRNVQRKPMNVGFKFLKLYIDYFVTFTDITDV